MTHGLVETTHDFLDEVDGLVVKTTQEIPQAFLDGLRTERDLSHEMLTRDMARVASIPEFVVELWRKQGFDLLNERPSAIIQRLKRDGLDAFVTTRHQV